MIIKTARRKQISAILLLLMTVFLLLSPAVYAQQDEDIVVEVEDGYEELPDSGKTYDVLLTHDEGTVGEAVSFQVEVTVGGKESNFDGMSIEVPDGVTLVEVEAAVSPPPVIVEEGVTTRYITGSSPDKIYGTYQILGANGLDASYTDPSNCDPVAKDWTAMYEDDTASTLFGRILLSAANWDSRLNGKESIVLFFDAVADAVKNEFIFYGVKPVSTGNETSDLLNIPFKMGSSEVIVNPRVPDPVVPQDSFEPIISDSDFTFPEEPLADQPVSTLEEDTSASLISAPVAEVVSPVEEPVVEEAAVVDGAEIELLPETPETEPLGQVSIVKWPFLLLLAVLVLVWFAVSLLVLVRVPGSDGSLKTLSRKLARRKDKRWYVDVEKELDKYLAKYGEVMVDFRGGLIKGAKKAVYSGDTVLSADKTRYAIINKQRYTSWVDELKKEVSKTA